MNSKCSPLSSHIVGAKKGCIPANDYKYIKNIYDKIAYHEKKKCDEENELCLLEQIIENKAENDFIREIYSLYYKPVTPSDWYECKKKFCNKKWLNNRDINNIMIHYMELYKNFEFLGIFYVDYIFHGAVNISGDRVPLYKMNFDSLNKENKNICAMIFNTASFGSAGEHWIALMFFWKGDTGEINYFDSYGNNTRVSPFPDEILLYMKMIMSQGQKYGISFTCQSSRISHQKNNGECGIYCLYFIIYMLSHSLDSITERIPDDEIAKYRDIYWRK